MHSAIMSGFSFSLILSLLCVQPGWLIFPQSRTLNLKRRKPFHRKFCWQVDHREWDTGMPFAREVGWVGWERKVPLFICIFITKHCYSSSLRQGQQLKQNRWFSSVSGSQTELCSRPSAKLWLDHSVPTRWPLSMANWCLRQNNSLREGHELYIDSCSNTISLWLAGIQNLRGFFFKGIILNYNFSNVNSWAAWVFSIGWAVNLYSWIYIGAWTWMCPRTLVPLPKASMPQNATDLFLFIFSCII